MFKDVVKGVAKNTSIMMFQQVITWVASLILMLFLPRYLGPVEYGKLFLALSIYEIFRVLVSYGGNFLVAKYVSRDHTATAQIVTDATVLRLLIAALSAAMLVGAVYLADYPVDTEMTIFAVAIMLVWQGGLTALYAAYQGHEALKFTSFGAIVERVVISVVGVTSLLLGAGKLVIAMVMSLGNLLNFVSLLAFAPRIIPSIPRVNWRDVFAQLRSGLPYFLFAVFGTIYNRIDSLMLSKMSPGEVVGWYGGAFRLFDMMNFLPYILTVALYPVLSRLGTESNSIHGRTTQKGLEIVILAAFPMTIGVFFFANDIISLLYSLENYQGSVPILRILTCGLMLLYVDMILVTGLISSDKQREFSLISLAAIPIKFFLNFVLINYFQAAANNGGIGAAISTGITEGCIMIATLILLPKVTLSGFRVAVIGKSAVASALMFGVIWLGWNIGIYWIALIPVGAVVYGTMLLLLKTFEPAEMQFLKQLVAARSLRQLKDLLKQESAG